jgi:hypothetical protein
MAETIFDPSPAVHTFTGRFEIDFKDFEYAFSHYNTLKLFST